MSGFFGRKEELSLLKHALDRGQSVGVFGLRKAGKTSLLNALERVRRDEGHFVVKLDVSEIASADEFRLRLLTRTWEAVEGLRRGDDADVAMHPSVRLPRLRLLNARGQAKPNVSQLSLFWTDDLRLLITAAARRSNFVDRPGLPGEVQPAR